MVMATANVQTLLPSHDEFKSAQVSGALLTGKVALLEIQFANRGIDWIGLQEGRARDDTVRSGCFYEMYISKGTEIGTLGVQVWVKKSLNFRPQCVIRKSPRLMCVVGKIGSFINSFIFVSAHAPTSVACPTDRDEFWKAVDSLQAWIDVQFPGAFVSLAIDGNARLGEQSSPGIGGTGKNMIMKMGST